MQEIQPKDIINIFKDGRLTFDDILSLIKILHTHPKNTSEMTNALEGLEAYVHELYDSGRSVYPVKGEIRDFILIIIKKYRK